MLFRSLSWMPLLMISELDERMRDLKNELQSFEGGEYDESHRRKAVDALNRMESWNLFSDTHEVCHLIHIDFNFSCPLLLLMHIHFIHITISRKGI